MNIAEENTKFFATPLQAGMIFNALASPNSGVDVEHITILCEEKLDIQRLLSCWDTVITRHSALRSRFNWTSHADVLVEISDESLMPYEFDDWSDKSAEEISNAQIQTMYGDRVKGFELDAGSPMRLLLRRLSDHSYWLLWSFHHSILDGRSFPIVLREVFLLYDTKGTAELPEPNDFSTYVEGIKDRDKESQLKYWAGKLDRFESDCKIPTLSAAEASAFRYSSSQALVKGRLTYRESDQLRLFAKKNGVGIHTLVQACWSLLLHHYTGSEFVVFGDTRALRHAVPSTQETVGLLINTLPFPVQISKEISTEKLLQEISATQSELRLVETTSLVDLVAQRNGKQIFSSMIMFDSQNLDTRLRNTESVLFEHRTFAYQGQTNYPISLIVYDESEIEFQIEFDTRQYRSGNCQRMLDQFKNLLLGIESNLHHPATKIPYLTSCELDSIKRWNNTNKPYNLEKTLVDLFETQVDNSPNQIALKFGDDFLTYSQFDRQVNKLAHFLREQGLKLDEVVAVCCDRSLEMMTSIYAIVKAGGSYLPLDTNNPVNRTKFILGDSKVKLFVGHQKYIKDIEVADCEFVAIENSVLWDHCSEERPDRIVRANNLAYTLYTSGSTGEPKGVMNEHRGIVNRLLWMQDVFKLDASDVVLQKTPYTFDVSVWELFWPLLVGARLVLAKPDEHKDPSRLVKYIVDESVSTLHFVPSMLQLFLEDVRAGDCHAVNRVICSGEALTVNLQTKFFKTLSSTSLHNLYGPTEAAIDVTWWKCDRESDLNHVPIGSAIANTQIHILDKNLLPVPVGVPGELFIGGVQVARGYRNRPILTAERFIPDPNNPEARIYKTGDLARYMEDGNIEYVGRTDFQVKIRGQRIELGEIEAVLLSSEKVNEVVVTATTDPAGEQVLVAYVVGTEIEVDALKAHAAQFLSSYMVPSLWVVQDRFVLNSSGKVDRKKLRVPDFTVGSSKPTGMESALEIEIQSIWSELLGKPVSGVDDSFFDLGGSSLSIVRLAVRLSEKFNKTVGVQDVLRESTIAKQANFLSVDSTSDKDIASLARTNAAKQKRARARSRIRKGV